MKNKKETNYGMFLAYLTLFTALTISGVAIFYSVSGLAAIFSAAVIPIIIMGGVLEVSKLVTAVWLHKYWKEATWWLKGYLSIAVLVLMLITSIGIFGFLSKAHDTASGNATEAIATVTRIDGQIAREENRIEILEDRITGISSGTGFDVTSSITQQETIRDGAWDRVQDDIDYAQGQIDRLRDQLATLDSAVNELRNKGVEVITTEEGGLFQGDTTQTIDYVAQADTLYNQQKEQRDSIDEDIDDQQSNIDSYRLQAQNTINSANAEINRLRNQSTSSQDDDLNQIDEWNLQIDGIYNTIDGLKDEKFESEQAVRLVESEVGPIRYIAEFFTGTEDADASLLESAVSWLIMIIIFVFDPLAVLLLIASQYTFDFARKNRKSNEWKDYETNRGNMIARNEEPKKSDAPEEEPKYEDVDQATLDKEFDDEFVGLEDDEPKDEEYEKRKERYERVMAPHRSKDKVDQTKEWQELYKEDDKLKQEFNDEFGDMEELTKEVDKDGDGIDDNTGQPITGIGEVKGTFADAGKKKDTESPEESKDLESWNKWVAAAEEEVTKETIDKRVQEVASQENDKVWNDAKRKWKEENPNQNAKDWKHAYISGRIHELPWATLVNNEQEGYVQNAEQSESSVWNKLQDSDNK